jgi:hypothetical protein
VRSTAIHRTAALRRDVRIRQELQNYCAGAPKRDARSTDSSVFSSSDPNDINLNPQQVHLPNDVSTGGRRSAPVA